MSIVFFALALGVLLTAVFVLIRDPSPQRSKPTIASEKLSKDDKILRELLLEMELDAIDEGAVALTFGSPTSGGNDLPEPGTFVLFGAVLGAGWFIRRRRTA